MPYRICYITAEYAPLAKVGGLSDVSAALSRYLHRRGDEVRVFLPLYRQIAAQPFARTPVAGLENLALRLGRHEYRYTVVTGTAAGSDLPLLFIDCPELYDRPQIYSDAPDDHRRFLLLTRAAFECCQRLGFAPHILHCNDWHTAFAPLLLRTLYRWDRLFEATRSVLTIHNMGYQGSFAAADAADLDLGDDAGLLHQQDLSAGRINPLLHGIMYADRVTTVSPTYAREIATPEQGHGLDGFLRARPEPVVGILNGVDYDEWSPENDRYLPAHYTRTRLAGKERLKREIAARLKLDLGPHTLLLGLVSRLVPQKGMDLLPGVLPEVLRRHDLACVALGSGEPRYERFLASLQESFPGRVAYHRGHNEELAHWIEAACDAFLMPSLYEPCGLNQLYSLRYGTVPIVRRTGGLADSVIPHFEPHGTGFVFEHFDEAGLGWALDTALELYADRVKWLRLVRNGMAADFSWERQGALYVELYRQLAGPA
jgi:starch synthase